ncbi:hypothetical protein CA598_06105 [Paenibacillus sp. VTT E-133291]|nr:hypothetical protein CA598_06105 [Paenibacillus sp. VTT E-133291]
MKKMWFCLKTFFIASLLTSITSFFMFKHITLPHLSKLLFIVSIGTGVLISVITFLVMLISKDLEENKEFYKGSHEIANPRNINKHL